MKQELIIHRSCGNYAYIVGHNEAEILLQVGKDDFKKVEIIYFDQYLIHEIKDMEVGQKEMKEVAQTEYCSYYRVRVKPPRNRLGYYFKLTSNDGSVTFFNEMGCVEQADSKDLKNFFISYLNQEDCVQVPEWAKDGVCYQIFPDSFSTDDGKVSSKTPESQYELRGGTLKGITKRLDYLKDLGITAIYTTPIFKANTSHRYETVDYMEIDPRLGTKEDFKTLVDCAHQRGIKVILDAVFNHTSSHFFAFEDVLENQEKSIYKEWYYINEFPISRKDYPLKYETFASVADMPKLNTHNSEVEEYLLDVVAYWTKNFNIDGWRLDVANEIGLTFWRKFREIVKQINPEAIIIGESWNDSYRYLQGDTFDSVMNYPLRTWLFGLLAKYSLDRSLDQYQIDIIKFQNKYEEFTIRYPKPIFDVLLNLMGSHDVPRIRTYFEDERIIHLITAMQLTLSGFPCIYYGDEIGLGKITNCNLEGNRVAMCWDKEQNIEVFNYYKHLIQLRHEHVALRRGDLEFLETTNSSVLAYKKYTKKEAIIVIANVSDRREKYVIEESSETQVQLYGETPLDKTYLEAFEVKIIKIY
ncbi:MAG: alpha-glycosidase [Vallitalea sp.]|jgi:glycosidase|nr:alpha-glycosidase [Vallitalea sp.]